MGELRVVRVDKVADCATVVGAGSGLGLEEIFVGSGRRNGKGSREIEAVVSVLSRGSGVGVAVGVGGW